MARSRCVARLMRRHKGAVEGLGHSQEPQPPGDGSSSGGVQVMSSACLRKLLVSLLAPERNVLKNTQ
jgi:hypothetical protein